MGPRRGEHLLSERERSRVVSPIQPPVPSQFSASLRVPALVPLSGCVLSLSSVVTLHTSCPWSESHNNTWTGWWETVFLAVNKLPSGEHERGDELTASIISLRLFRCNSELEAVGEENINSIATNPSCDCETFHSTDISRQPIWNEIKIKNCEEEKETETTETCKPSSPEIYEEENECDNKVQSLYKINSQSFQS